MKNSNDQPTSTKSRGNNKDGVVLISRTLHPRYCSRNYASKIHLLPALTNFRQTRFPGFRKYLHGSAAVIPASRRPLCLLPSPIHPSGLSLQPWKISRDYDFFSKFPSNPNVTWSCNSEGDSFVVQLFVNHRIDDVANRDKYLIRIITLILWKENIFTRCTKML